MRTKKKKTLRDVIGVLFVICGIIGGMYTGLWVMFIQPIMYACSCFDAGTLTGVIIGQTILKCIFAPAVGWLLVYASMFMAAIVRSY